LFFLFAVLQRAAKLHRIEKDESDILALLGVAVANTGDEGNIASKVGALALITVPGLASTECCCVA
jgi:hypothetical protein